MQLNRQQHNAVRSGSGVSLVIAGAGTGKTRTLVEKVCRIIRDRTVSPDEILITTFSRKAANELRERIHSSGAAGRDITAGTFHSFCLQMLKEFASPFVNGNGFSRFPDIVDGERKIELYRELITPGLSRFKGIPREMILNCVGRLETMGSVDRNRLAEAGVLDNLLELRKSYGNYKIRNNLMDYDDMMDYGIELLEKHENVRKTVRERYRFLLVDEFQDTSPKNFRLLSYILPEEKRNLFVVGDDWQSIYGFRGARPEYTVGIRKFFPESVIYKLTVNYRSRKEIVDLSNRFICRNRKRTRKKLSSHRGRGGRVQGFIVRTRDEEYERIRHLLEGELQAAGDVAILYRNNWQGEKIEKNILDGLSAAERDRVKPMTIHSSKGLEFRSVILCGISDRIIPDPSTPLEDERRLLYVALTRARERLYLICYEEKTGVMSRFAAELGFSEE